MRIESFYIVIIIVCLFTKPGFAQEDSRWLVIRDEERKEWEELGKKDPQKLEEYLNLRRQQIRQKLEELKSKNPQEFQRIISQYKRRLKERLKRIKERNPDRLRSLMERRHLRRRRFLEELKRRKPEEFDRLYKLRKKRIDNILEKIKNKDPQRFQRLEEYRRRFLIKKPPLKRPPNRRQPIKDKVIHKPIPLAPQRSPEKKDKFSPLPKKPIEKRTPQFQRKSLPKLPPKEFKRHLPPKGRGFISKKRREKSIKKQSPVNPKKIPSYKLKKRRVPYKLRKNIKRPIKKIPTRRLPRLKRR